MANYRWNWRPTNPVFIDLETQSPVNLKEAGSRKYLRDSMTRLMCLVAMRGESVLVWIPRGRYPGSTLHDRIKPGDLWPDGIARGRETIHFDDGDTFPAMLLNWIADGCTLVAHNAGGFDAEAFDRLVTQKFGGENPDSWCDTLPLAKAGGYPGSLDALGQVFLGTGKDAGKDVLKLLYTCRIKADECIYPLGTPAAWKSVLRYNVKDVLLLKRVYESVCTLGEPDMLDAHTAINARGVKVDLPLIGKLTDLWTELHKEACAEIVRLTDGELHKDNLRSVPTIKAWLRKQGVQVDSINRQVLERLYENPDEFFAEAEDLEQRHAYVCEVLRVRQAVTRIGVSKLQRICELMDPDGRVRDIIVPYGAHTGRFSGRGVQPHNFARGVADLDVQSLLAEPALDIPTIRRYADRCGAQPRADDVLSTILRPVFCAEEGATLAIADYAAIEGRGVAWVADQENLLDIFRTGGDVYCDMAGKIYGRSITKKDKTERQVGKVTVLGCGYSMSANKFAAYCKINRIDLDAAGTTAEACVEAYRDAYPRIAGTLNGKFRRNGIWQKYQQAAKDAVEKNAIAAVGKCRFYMRNGNLNIQLPSGRCLAYRSARMELMVPPYAAALGLVMEPRPTIAYAHHHGYTATLYGGLLTENIVQAICRDLLVAALIRAEQHGLRTVLHVHDEIVCETGSPEADLRDLCCIMSKPPAWADGFPIAVEGFTCPHYVKSSWKGSYVCEAREGVVTSCKLK